MSEEKGVFELQKKAMMKTPDGNKEIKNVMVGTVAGSKSISITLLEDESCVIYVEREKLAIRVNSMEIAVLTSLLTHLNETFEIDILGQVADYISDPTNVIRVMNPPKGETTKKEMDDGKTK